MASNKSDEDIVLISNLQSWSVRKQPMTFPLVIGARSLQLIYTRSYGPPAIVLLFLYQSRSFTFLIRMNNFYHYLQIYVI